MDGIHDLGGKHGFGPVQLEKDEEQFHDEWEARARAIVMAMNRAPIELGLFRHCRGRSIRSIIRPYCLTNGASMVPSGNSLGDLEELAQVSPSPRPPKPANAR